MVSSDKGVVVRQSLFLCPTFFTFDGKIIVWQNVLQLPINIGGCRNRSSHPYYTCPVYYIKNRTLLVANQYPEDAAGGHIRITR